MPAASDPGARATEAAPDAAERRYAVRLVKQRLQPAAFRDGVLHAYNHRCATSNLPTTDTSHIMANTDETLDRAVVSDGIALLAS
jgi:putative restriction endonuclease